VFRRITAEADSVDEAIARMQVEAPAGYEVLLTEVIAQPKVDIITSSAPTIEAAFAKARHKVPKGASLTEETVVRNPGAETLEMEAADEADARSQVKEQLQEGAKLQFLKLEAAGSKGFLGFGKKPNRYRAQLFYPATVRIGYRLRAKVSATLMSAEAARQARAAVQELVDLHDQTAAQESHQRIREIGQFLEGIGGIDLMLAVHTLFVRERPNAGRLLEEAWDGIGAWIR